MTEITCDDLTPKAVHDLLAEKGGGMVLGVVMCVQIATEDGRHDVTFWDSDSAMSTQLGLSALLYRVIDERVDASCRMFTTEDDSLE